MPDEHAVLSPSSAERWIECPASVRMAAAAPPQPDSPYAAEGTHAHTWAEAKARHRYLGMSDAELMEIELDLEATCRERGWDAAEMERHAVAYTDLIGERLAEHPHSRLFLERRVFSGIEGCWGTADCIIVSPEHVEIIDFKYGKGVSVSAVRNPQLMLYGVGALDGYGDLLGEVERVYCTVYQPRIDNTSTYQIGAANLRLWRDGLMEVAASALDGTGGFGPSETACRWCPARGECAAALEHAVGVDFGELSEDDPETLTPEQLGEALDRIPEIKAWIAAVEDLALRRIYTDGAKVPGWKVVLSGGKRVVRDPELAAARLREIGYVPEDYLTPPKLVGVTALDKLVGKGNLAEVLGEALERTEGSPSLTTEDDKRPDATPASQAARDFDDL